MARKGTGGGARQLETLLDAGDHRAARAEAERLLGAPDARGAEREAARIALARLAPDRGALVVAAVALALFVAAFLLGILHRP